MNVSRLFIQRPVATALFMLAIVLAGLVGLRFLPLAALPQVDYPTIQVQTLYPGGSPDVMSRTVTAPLERQFGQMPGLARMSSTSSAGVSMITLQFALTIAASTFLSAVCALTLSPALCALLLRPHVHQENPSALRRLVIGLGHDYAGLWNAGL